MCKIVVLLLMRNRNNNQFNLALICWRICVLTLDTVSQ